MIFTAVCRTWRLGLGLIVTNTIDPQNFLIHRHSSVTLWLVAHLGTFVQLALERFFSRLALMVLDFGRVL